MSAEFTSKYNNFQWLKWYDKCRLQNGGHLVWTLWVNLIEDTFGQPVYIQSGACMIYSKYSFVRRGSPSHLYNKANLRDLIAATGLVISNCTQIDDFSARVTMKFDGWPKKTIGHFFCSTWIFVHHYKSIGEFKLELQSRNAQFGDILSCGTLKFDGWPWKIIGHLFYTTSSFVHHFKAVGEVKLELQSWNAQFGLKSAIFSSCVNLKFDGWPWKTIGHPPMLLQALCIIS